MQSYTSVDTPSQAFGQLTDTDLETRETITRLRLLRDVPATFVSDSLRLEEKVDQSNVLFLCQALYAMRTATLSPYNPFAVTTGTCQHYN
jgi:hypothetical protein